MFACPQCGTRNRQGARFCAQCATTLTILPAPRPTADDAHWLAATLSGGESSIPVPAASVHLAEPGAQSAANEEDTMESPQAESPTFGTRYQVEAHDTQGRVTVVDREPWHRCWACGSTANEAGERFCIDCGAALEERSYQGRLTPVDAPTGIALVAGLIDPERSTILPIIWDQVEREGQLLTLLADTGQGPLTPPIDTVAALRIGRALAALMVDLHPQGVAIGSLDPADITFAADGTPRLHDLPAAASFDADSTDQAVKADLQILATLLESLTDTPRKTRRLAEDEALDPETVDLARTLSRIRTGAFSSAGVLLTEFDELLSELTRPVALRQVYGARSDTGIVRDHNEDSLLTLHLTLDNSSIGHAWGLYVVADGMGGHAAGEVASGLACRGAAELVLREFLTPLLDSDLSYDERQVRDLVLRAALQANDYVVREGQNRGNDMGATLTMALVVGDRATIANVGDSRTYLYRDGKLRRISKDHSLVMRLVELGQLGEDEIYSHPQRNAVLRSLGDTTDVEVDVFNERLRPDDALLLCSDGQWEMTHDPEMELILARYPDPQEACDQLVAAANQAGGEDNITAVLIRFV